MSTFTLNRSIRNTLDRFFIESHGGRVVGYADNIDSTTAVTTQEG